MGAGSPLITHVALACIGRLRYVAICKGDYHGYHFPR